MLLSPSCVHLRRGYCLKRTVDGVPSNAEKPKSLFEASNLRCTSSSEFKAKCLGLIFVRNNRRNYRMQPPNRSPILGYDAVLSLPNICFWLKKRYPEVQWID